MLKKYTDEDEFKVIEGYGVWINHYGHSLSIEEIQYYFRRFQFESELVEKYYQELEEYRSFFKTLKGFLDLSEITKMKKEQEQLENKLRDLNHQFSQHKISDNRPVLRQRRPF